MVFLVLTKQGFQKVQKEVKINNLIIWVNNNILSENELTLYRNQGFQITNFFYTINSTDTIEEALTTISEHHPNEPIFIEH